MRIGGPKILFACLSLAFACPSYALKTGASPAAHLADLTPCEALTEARLLLVREGVDLQMFQVTHIDYDKSRDLWTLSYNDGSLGLGSSHFSVTVTDERPPEVALVPGL